MDKIKCKLKEIRMKEYMIDSKKEFAKMLEVEEHTYLSWENEKGTPTLRKALEVALKLNRNINDIWHL